MFKKRTRTFGRKGTRLETRAHAARAFKRVVRQWQLSQNIKCQIVHATPGESCPNGGKIVVMSNDQLQGNLIGANANFPDAVRIRRIEGHLYFRPLAITAAELGVAACFEAAASNLQRTTYMRMGLRKAQGPQSQSGTPDALNPLDNGATPYEISDYADGRWMKMWEHVWDAGARLEAATNNAFNCCSVQDSYIVPDWTMATGSGTWPGYTVPPIVCEPCGDPENPAINLGCNFSAAVPRFWHVPIRYGRPIVLKENDDLGLYFGWETLMNFDDVARKVQTPMEFFGGIRLLLES